MSEIKPHSYNLAEWEHEQRRVENARKSRTGTIGRRWSELIRYTTEMLKHENNQVGFLNNEDLKEF